MAGVHRDTLLRWLRDGLIQEPQRDRRNWRLFSESEAAAIATFANGDASLPSDPIAKRDHKLDASGLDRLRKIDWDFAEAKTRYLTHGLHPYPAKFIPQIPNALIQELSSVGETVADIFCGSGTALVEALILKRNAVGVDANPLACLISHAKVTQFVPGDAEELRDLVLQSQDLAKQFRPAAQGSLFGDIGLTSAAPRPDHSAIGFWFEPFVVEELAEILRWCNSLSTCSSRHVALTAFSSIVVAVSKQDSDTRYVRREKNLEPGDTLDRFARALDEAVRAVEEFTEIVEPRFTSRIENASVLSSPEIGPVELVVCSPPYPNAYSYHLYHMTRMVWLGMDQPRFKTAEIGSHRKYSNRGRNGATITTFKDEMLRVFEWLRVQLKRDRYACFVVGNSIIDRKTFCNADIIAEVAEMVGFVEDARIGRQMQETKKAFNPAYGKIKEEQILVLRNSKGVTK